MIFHLCIGGDQSIKWLKSEVVDQIGRNSNSNRLRQTYILLQSAGILYFRN